ncbi:unnamed protein product [Camellia sinensis]
MASPTILSPCSSGRRSSDSNSPEFEFCMLRNPSFPQPTLLSADELFVDGVLLPLHLLPPYHHHPPDDPHPQPPNPQSTTPNPDPPPNPELATRSDLSIDPPGSSATALTASKRWKALFKKSDRKIKEKKKEIKAGTGGATSAELNINLWPFSRSRSAGNGGTRPKMVAGTAATRKVSSAPCSRSNSAGESKSKKWPNSPNRGGVHLGRSSPVWQVRRGGSGGTSSDRVVVRNVEKGVRKDGNENRRKKSSSASTASAGGVGGDGSGGAKARTLNLNVPMCIGYRQHLSCRSGVSAEGGGGSGSHGGGGSSPDDGGRGEIDAVYSALASLGFKKVPLQISETSWPSKGDEDEARANLDNGGIWKPCCYGSAIADLIKSRTEALLKKTKAAVSSKPIVMRAEYAHCPAGIFDIK